MGPRARTSGTNDFLSPPADTGTTRALSQHTFSHLHVSHLHGSPWCPSSPGPRSVPTGKDLPHNEGPVHVDRTPLTVYSGVPQTEASWPNKLLRPESSPLEPFLTGEPQDPVGPRKCERDGKAGDLAEVTGREKWTDPRGHRCDPNGSRLSPSGSRRHHGKGRVRKADQQPPSEAPSQHQRPTVPTPVPICRQREGEYWHTRVHSTEVQHLPQRGTGRATCTPAVTDSACFISGGRHQPNRSYSSSSGSSGMYPQGRQYTPLPQLLHQQAAMVPTHFRQDQYAMPLSSPMAAQAMQPTAPTGHGHHCCPQGMTIALASPKFLSLIQQSPLSGSPSIPVGCHLQPAMPQALTQGNMDTGTGCRHGPPGKKGITFQSSLAAYSGRQGDHIPLHFLAPDHLRPQQLNQATPMASQQGRPLETTISQAGYSTLGQDRGSHPQYPTGTQPQTGTICHLPHPNEIHVSGHGIALGLPHIITQDQHGRPTVMMTFPQNMGVGQGPPGLGSHLQPTPVVSYPPMGQFSGQRVPTGTVAHEHGLTVATLPNHPLNAGSGQVGRLPMDPPGSTGWTSSGNADAQQVAGHNLPGSGYQMSTQAREPSQQMTPDVGCPPASQGNGHRGDTGTREKGVRPPYTKSNIRLLGVMGGHEARGGLGTQPSHSDRTPQGQQNSHHVDQWDYPGM